MMTQTQLTLDRVLRIVISIGLVLSVLGTPAFVPLAQAKSLVAQSVSEPQPPATPEVEVTPTATPEATLPSLEAAQVVTATIDVTPIPPSEAAPQLPQQAQPPMQSLGKVAAEGGRVQSGDGRAQLEFPTGAVAGEAEVKYGLKHTRPYQDDGVSGSLIEFELEAVKTGKAAQAEKVSHFEKPLTLTIDLTGLLDLEHIPVGYYVYLYTVTPEGYQNPVWPITIDGQAGTISAQVDHFSGWGAGLAPGTPGVWEFNYTAPEVALYSGAATAQIPLQVPAGRNGLQPNLSLSYNSATLNGLSGAVRGTRDWTRGGELGGFWGLDGTAKIAREKWDSCRWGDASNWRYTSCFKDVFTLILGGTGYTLVPAAGDQIYGRYYAEGGPDLYIYRYNNCSAHSTGTGRCTTSNPSGNPSTSNETGEWWLVRTADGTAIEFGKTIDAEQVAGNICNPLNDAMNCKKPFDGGGNYGMGYRGSYAGASNGNPSKAARAWWANKFTDQFNNTMEVSYYTYWYDNGERVTPKEIKYNSAAGGSYLSRVKFEGHAEIVNGINPPDNEPTIDRVEMYTKDSGGVEQLVHKYLFTRTFYNRTKWVGACNEMYPNPEDRQPGVNCGNIPSYFEVLNSVQEVSGSGASLPVQTFGYEWRNTRDWNDIMQLTSVNNGYGAVTTFGYAVATGSFCSFAGCNDYAVSNRRVSAGAGTPDMYATYDYGQVCYDAYNPGGPTECASRATILCGLDCDFDRFVKLSGFGVVTATQWAGTTAAARSKHYFKNANPAWIKGREYKTEQLDPANNNALLTSQVTTWSDKWYGAWFAFAGDQTATTYNGGQAASTRTSYTVNEYNNVVSEYQYGAGLRMLNAGFENALTNWNQYYSAGGAPVATSSTDTSFAGNYSLKLSGTGNTGGVYQDVGGLLPNVNYTARVRVKWSNPSASGTFRLWLHDTTTNGNNGRTSNLINPGNDGWSVVTVSYPANATGAVRLHMDYEVVSNGAIYVDEVELARTTDIGDERSTHRTYGHNPAANEWIIGKLTKESVYAEIRLDDSNTQYLKARTRYRYDGACTFSQSASPSQGLVTAVDQWNGLLGSDTCGSGQINPAFYSSYTTYDAWGNPLTMTDARGNTTSATYDNDYHLYPLQVTNAKNQSSQYQFYGINGVATDNTPIGSLKKTIDPNNAETLYTYDSLGRLLKVVRPYDSVTYPSTEYRYDLGGDVHAIQTYQREASGVGSTTDPTVGTLWSVNWFDGLGRTYQSRTEAGDGSIRVQDTFYDALGRTITQSVPYTVTTGGRYATPADLSQPRTTTTYDTLGRVRQVTAPDGTQTTHSYLLDTTSGNGYTPTGLQLHAVVDANQHGKHYVTDASNQLVVVRELTGTVAPRPLYGETKYTYNTLGNLTQVRDALGNTTVMTYNTFSQKTGMLDPDMGAWSYQYDAAGNLIQQTDAKSQVLVFNYDPLNRLLDKRQGGQTGTILASYTYDQGTNGVGRRTSVTDQSGSANWVYDLRGCVLNERKAIGEPQVLEAESSSYHQIGSAENGAWLSPATGSPSYLTYGPYQAPTAVGPGQVAIFRLALDTIAGTNNTIARLDVYDSTSAQQLVTRLLSRQEFLGGLDKFSDFAVTFDTTGRAGHNLEYRVYWYGNSQLAHDKTSLSWSPYTTSYTYDTLDRAQTITYPTGEVVTQTYNAASQLTSVAGTNNYASGMTYNALGQIKQVMLGNGATTTFDYYGNGGPALNSFRLWRTQTTKSGTNLLELQYKYDNVGNVKVITDVTNSNQVLTFNYDDLDRLTGAGTNAVGMGQYPYQGFAYNEVGNFLHKNNVTQTYADPAHKHAVTKAGNDLFTYDANGNMLTRQEGSTTYEQVWDSENRVKAVDVAQPPSMQDAFTTLNTSAWNFSCQGATPGCQSIENGTLRSIGTGSNWNGNFSRSAFNFNGGQQGQAVQVEFKVDRTDTAAHVSLEASGNRRFGLVADSGKIVAQHNADGATWIYADLVKPVETGVWYVALLKLKPDGQATVEVWRKDDPGKHGSATFQMPTGLSYRFHHWIWRGNAWLDNYQERDYQSTQYFYDGDGNRVKKVGYQNLAAGRVPTSNGALVWPTAITNGDTWADTMAGTGEYAYINESGSRYVQLDLGGIHTVDQIKVWHFALDGRTYHNNKTEVSADGVTWTPVFDTAISGEYQETAAGRTTTFSARPVRYVRDYLNGSTANAYQHWVEIEVWGTATTVYVNGLYEKSLNTNEGTSYYFAGAQRVAMRQGSNLYYFVADHLGSTSVTLDASGNKISEQKYYPFGETRSGSSPTDRQFTGQRAETGLGSLYDYNARMYSPVLGRFLSADTIVPDSSNPQSLNRFSYTRNNPLKYIDPSGHIETCTQKSDPCNNAKRPLKKNPDQNRGKKVEELRDQGKFQDAVDAAVDGYGIKIPAKTSYPVAVNGWKVKMNSISNQITRSTGGVTDGNGSVEIYKGAFYHIVGKLGVSPIFGNSLMNSTSMLDMPFSAGFVASVIGHEEVHAGRVAARTASGPGDVIGAAIMEVEATDWQLAHAAEFDLTLKEISMVYQYRKVNYDLLPMNLQGQVDRGDYTIP